MQHNTVLFEVLRDIALRGIRTRSRRATSTTRLGLAHRRGILFVVRVFLIIVGTDSCVEQIRVALEKEVTAWIGAQLALALLLCEGLRETDLQQSHEVAALQLMRQQVAVSRFREVLFQLRVIRIAMIEVGRRWRFLLRRRGGLPATAEHAFSF